MPKCAYLPDGYTETGRLDETEECPAVEFKFRPPIGPERSFLLDEEERIRKPGTTESIRAAIQFTIDSVISHLVSWDVTDANGAPLPITVETLRRLHPGIFGRLCNYVLWGPPSRPKQQAGDVKN